VHLLSLLFVFSACKGKLEHKLGVQVENLEKIADWPELTDSVVHLRAIGRPESLDRDMLILQPVGCLIPYNIGIDALLSLMKQFAGIVQQLAARGYLHGDLSYYNLLKRQDTDEALLVDMQTLMSMAKVLTNRICMFLCTCHQSLTDCLMLVCRLLQLNLPLVRLCSWHGMSFANGVTMSALSWNR